MPNDHLEMPSTIGPYAVVRRLGHGGQAQTFKVRMSAPGEEIERFGCLKMLHHALAFDDKARKRFRKEAEVASTLNHRNLVSILGYDLDHNPPYLIYQMVDGVDLAKLQAWQRLTVEDVLYIASEVAAGLHYAHHFKAEGITRVLHRDIAPKNIMLSRSGDVFLTDFGMSKFQSDMSGSVTVDFGGTPAYIPPEALMQRKLDERGDMYALGVVLYELAAGRRPVQHDNVIALLYAMANGDYPSVADTAPQYPTAFLEMVQALMSREMDDRPTAQQVLEVLSECGASRAQRSTVGRLVHAAMVASAVTPVPPALSEQQTIPRGVVTKGRANKRVALAAGALLALGGAGAYAVFGSGDGGEDVATANSGATAPGVELGGENNDVNQRARDPKQDHTDPTLGTANLKPGTAGAKPGGADSKRQPGSENGSSGQTLRAGNGRDGQATSLTTHGEDPGVRSGSDTTLPMDPPVVEKPSTRPDPPAKPTKARPRKGWVKVFVVPWGEVTIDGRPYGRAPVGKVRLSAGKHRVTAKMGGSRRSKTVHVKAGATRTVRIEFPE